MGISEDAAVLRIGVLSRRLGVSDHVLRSWEKRYGLLRPVRTPGGFRLYSEADARRVRSMQEHLARGLSAAEAARAVLAEADVPEAGSPQAASELRQLLSKALDGFDEPGAQAVLDRLFSDLSVSAVLRDVVLPYLADLGYRWERGQASIAQEHFASNLIRGRLAGLARGWGEGHGPRAVLACPPGERHDLAPCRVADRLPRRGHPGHGAQPGGTSAARRPGRAGRDPATDARATADWPGRADARVPTDLGRGRGDPGAGRRHWGQAAGG